MSMLQQIQPQTLGAAQRLVREIPGFIYRHRQTGELLGILSCDSGHWLETVDAQGFVRECHLRDVTNAYERVVKGTLRATRSTRRDHGGEFPTTYEVWSVGRGELLAMMREAAEKAAA